MPDWLLWLIGAGVLAAAETATLTFVLSMFAGGAAAGAVTAALGGPVALQIIVALVVTGLLLATLRPVARRHFTAVGPTRTGTDALIGMPAVTLTAVDAREGRVRLNGGEWTARSFDDSPIAADVSVRVVRISGATAYVLADDPSL
ncbi:NfeD family protein [Jatrophihabitans fulvus]